MKTKKLIKILKITNERLEKTSDFGSSLILKELIKTLKSLQRVKEMK